MDWKKFYRFSLVKLLLSVLLVVLPGLFILTGFTSAAHPNPFLSPVIIFLALFFFWPFILALLIEKLIFTNVDWIHAKDIPFIVIAFIINVLYIYTIACAIVFLFRNYRNGRKKQKTL